MSVPLHTTYVCPRCGDSTPYRCRLRGCPHGQTQTTPSDAKEQP